MAQRRRREKPLERTSEIGVKMTRKATVSKP